MALASAVLLSACSVFGVREGTETPRYEVVGQVGDLEIRRYAPRLAAETVVDGEEEAARSAGFRRVAAYIFGENRTKATIAMTAPVAQGNVGTNAGSGTAASGTIAMTAPVATQPVGEGKFAIRFFMPAEYTMQTLPEPVNLAVRIVTVPEETMAVYRFSGSRSAASMALARAELLNQLGGSAWRSDGAPVDWFYDPPWTLPPFRRNEVAVKVVPAAP